MLVSESGWIGQGWIWLPGRPSESDYLANFESDCCNRTAVTTGHRTRIWHVTIGLNRANLLNLAIGLILWIWQSGCGSESGLLEWIWLTNWIGLKQEPAHVVEESESRVRFKTHLLVRFNLKVRFKKHRTPTCQIQPESQIQKTLKTIGRQVVTEERILPTGHKH